MNATSESSSSSVVDCCVVMNTPAKENNLTRSQKGAQYLCQIIHSRRCNGSCKKNICKQTSTVLAHVQYCNALYCDVTGCLTTKRLIEHSKVCGLKDLNFSEVVSLSGNNDSLNRIQNNCIICSLARKMISSSINQSIASTDSFNGMNQYNCKFYNLSSNTNNDGINSGSCYFKKARGISISEAELPILIINTDTTDNDDHAHIEAHPTLDYSYKVSWLVSHDIRNSSSRKRLASI